MMIASEKDQAEKQKAEQIIAEIPSIDGVERVTVELGTDSSGNPAMWLIFHLRSDVTSTVSWILDFNEYAAKIQTKILHSGLTRFPYARLEQAA